MRTYHPEVSTVPGGTAGPVQLQSSSRGDQLRLYFQPVLALNGEPVAAMEVLLRWLHPRDGVHGPAELLRAAEEAGVMSLIDDWVLSEACLQQAAWQAETGHAPAVSVNVSAGRLADPEMVHTVSRVVFETGIAPESLILELPAEPLLNDIPLIPPVLGSLKKLGLKLAVDDFRPSTHELGTLRPLQIDLLKLERSVVANLSPDHGNFFAIRDIVKTAHKLNIEVAAKGVETYDQLKRLRELGCDYAQGFLLAQPKPAEHTKFTAGMGLIAELLATQLDPPEVMQLLRELYAI